MKRIWIVILALALIISAAACSQATEEQSADKAVSQEEATVEASTTVAGEYDYGAKSALEKENFTIEEMLNYAIQDEYLARQEYELIMEEYGEQKPFSNIIKAEENHIAELKAVFEANGYVIPEDTSSEYAMLPASLDEAFDVGVLVEIDNIAMYDKFLSYDLPSDVKAVFEELKKGSENHLAAFERGARGSGQGRMS
ncbi:MAG: DUF2202 domain-containing protein [Clostridia bacterium]|nr:DUF2202 domain-containing protein [Clostridia bacterium]